MAVYAETMELRCACHDVHNPSGAGAFHGGDPAYFDLAEQKFRLSHQGERCSVTVKRQFRSWQGRLL